MFAWRDGATTAPRRVFLTQIVDPAGNALKLDYDPQLRLVSLTDATGRTTTFSYELPGNPLLVTRITDPFGRQAVLGYQDSGQLASITDVLGLTSSFTYDAGGLVTSMTTPYGTTHFSFGQNTVANSRFLEITDPLGFAERVEFLHQAPGIANSEPVVPAGLQNAFLVFRNSFYWDRHALPLARPTPGGAIDYTKARLSHWLHNAANQTAPTLESTRNPLENRVWYTYPNQSSTIVEGALDVPTSVSRVLDDKLTAQRATATYNNLGKLLTSTDPRGRLTAFTYDANAVDLLAIKQQVATMPSPVLVTVATFTYNAQHLPLTSTDASGQTTRYAYDAAGQVVSVADPQNHVTSYFYDGLGRLTSVTDPNGTTALALTYDAYDRVATRTDAAGYVLAHEYDALDRLTKITYPDGTFEQYSYDKLDLASITDRRGNTTSYAYDADRRRVAETDPLGHVTKFDYYQNGVLKALTDANGHSTTWDIDIQGRPIAKRHADGTIETVAYEATTSRVASVTDARGQSTVYTYDIDDRVAAISYKNAMHPTPSVHFEYDPAFPRPISMTDGIGQTTLTYNAISTPPALGANRLRSLVSPVAGSPASMDTVTFTYDELGRVIGRAVNGSVQAATYDPLGRLTMVASSLDTFTYSYSDATARITGIRSSHGPRAAFSYFGPEGDDLMQEMTYTPAAGGAPLAQYGYTYDANHNVLAFTRREPASQAAASAASAAMGIATDRSPPRRLPDDRAPIRIRRLAAARAPIGLAVVSLLVIGSFVLSRTRARRARIARSVFAAQFVALWYCISCGDNIESSPAEVTAYAYDDADRLLSASVTVGKSRPGAQSAYTYDPASNLLSATQHGATRSSDYTATNAIVGATYDSNGSPTALDGSTYVWDAADRLVAVTRGGVETDLTYDGLSRVVRSVETEAGQTISDRSYTWCGNIRCVEHDNAQRGSPISKEYFTEGVVSEGEALYYVTDRLGSVRELVDETGKLRAQYDYDPYGGMTRLAGDLESDIGYGGYFNSAPGGLVLAVFRAYDPAHQRWLNRDPIGEHPPQGLYEYVSSNPTSATDPSGLLDRLYFDGTYLIGYDDMAIEFKVRAVSGSRRLKALPNGVYNATNLRIRGDSKAMMCNRKSAHKAGGPRGWSLDLAPTFKTERTLLRIHPDGNVPGTAGCIGVNCKNQAVAYDSLKQFFDDTSIDNPSIPVEVDIHR